VECERLFLGGQQKKCLTRAERAQQKKDQRAVVQRDKVALYASLLFEHVATFVGYSPHVSSKLPTANDDDNRM
jgi:hypothetical protein